MRVTNLPIITNLEGEAIENIGVETPSKPTINPIVTNTPTPPFANVKVYDLDEEIKPIPRPNAPKPKSKPLIEGTTTGGTTTGGTTTGGTTTGGTTTGGTTTTSGATTTTTPKKPNVLLYGVGALLGVFLVYKLFKK